KPDFDPNDYKNYPREIQSDRLKCEGAKVDIIFAPSVDEIYGRTGGITFDAGPASKILCGASREGHFEGVLQIVSKLFMLIKPQRAYFGQKDAQQLALIEMLVRDYYFPIQIVGVPIVRERDGLASSSRNVFLTEKQREEALLLHETLSTIRASYKKGENVETLIATSIQNIHQQTTATVEYLELLNYPNLTRDLQPNQQKVLAIAVNFPTVRLIDNSIF
ncbi:MAG: pantoate--beta-alanine ligase, partial [Kurthia sp.]